MEKKIIQCLKESKESITISEIARRLGINRITASKYLAILEAKGIISFRPVGKAKLYYIQKEDRK